MDTKGKSSSGFYQATGNKPRRYTNAPLLLVKCYPQIIVDSKRKKVAKKEK